MPTPAEQGDDLYEKPTLEVEQLEQAGEQHEAPEKQGAGGEEADDEQGTSDVGEQTPKTTQPSKSDEALEKFTAVLERMQAGGQQQQAPRKELTPEQVEKLLNPVKITPETLKMLGVAEPTEEMVKGYQALANMITKHHTSLMSVREEALLRRIAEYASPMEKFYQEQAANQQRQEFYKEFPKFQKFDKFVRFAATQVSPVDANGREKTVQQVKQEIIRTASELLKEAGVDVNAASEGDGSDTNLGAPSSRQSSVPRMTGLQSGGRSGGAQQGKTGGNNPDADIYN
jgi:hypothetical protein